MPDVTIVYWRDIPAQVIVGKGPTWLEGTVARTVRAGNRPRRDEGGCKRTAMPIFRNGAKPAAYEVDGDPRRGRGGRSGAA